MEGPGPHRSPPDPLIATALFDRVSFRILDDLRTRHFPPAQNIVPAHLTLFHHLPGGAEPEIAAHLAEACAGASPFGFTTAGTRFLGRGVAIVVPCPELLAFRGTLARRWSAWLTPQDRAGFKPHVTVQNKVSPIEARALEKALAGLPPVSGTIEGVALWRYRGGPWEGAGTFRFEG